MTYVYTKPAFRPYLERKTDNKPAKIAIVMVVVAAILTAAFMMMAPKSKPIPLATQPTIIEMPVQKTQTKAYFKIPASDIYLKADNAIRDVQMDNARLGHSVKVAVASDKNPIKRFLIAAERQFTFMGLLIGLSFIFMLYSFGFIRNPNSDLSNY